MKVSLESMEDVNFLNWPKIRELMLDGVAKKIAEALEKAREELKELEPGEERRYEIKIGEITISREPDRKLEIETVST